MNPEANSALQLTAQSAGALRVPSAAFGRSGRQLSFGVIPLFVSSIFYE